MPSSPPTVPSVVPVAEASRLKTIMSGMTPPAAAMSIPAGDSRLCVDRRRALPSVRTMVSWVRVLPVVGSPIRVAQ